MYQQLKSSHLWPVCSAQLHSFNQYLEKVVSI